MTDLLIHPLQQYLSERYTGAVVTHFEFLASGFESDVYSFILQVPDQPFKPLIIRLYPGEGAGQKMEREAAGLVHLQQAGYPVPTMLLTEPDAGWLGRPFNIMEKVEGRNLWSLLAGSEPEQQDILLKRFSALLARLHRLDWHPFSAQASLYEAHPQTPLTESLADTRRLYEQSGIPEFLPVVAWLEGHLKQIQVQLAVVHHDFHANNVLLRGDDLMVVIDWTQVAVTDYRIDLSWTLLIMGYYGQAHWGRQIVQNYEAEIGRPVDALDYFEVISDTKLLSAMLVLYRTKLASPNASPELAQSLRQQVPVFRALLERIREVTGISLPEVEAALL